MRRTSGPSHKFLSSSRRSFRAVAVNDRENDLDLVEPTRVCGQRDGDGIRINPSQPIWERVGMMHRSSVDNQEGATSALIRLLCHDQINQVVGRDDTRVWCDAAKERVAKHIPGRVIGDGSQSLILKLGQSRMPRRGRQALVTSFQDLDGLLVGGLDVLVWI